MTLKVPTHTRTHTHCVVAVLVLVRVRVPAGMMWPVEGMHPWLRGVGWALPLTLATTTLRYMMTRGWSPGLQHPEVLYGFVSTVAWIAIFLTTVLFVLRTHKK